MIKLIAAVDLNWGLGYKNELLFHIEEDMKRFRKLTEGHIVIMGRKTYESLNKPLKKRVNVVLTRDKNYKPNASGVFIEHDINKVLKYYLGTGKQDKDLWVIGGADIYEAFIECADEVHLTIIHKQANKADAYFPYNLLTKNGFKEREIIETFSNSSECKVTFITYVKF